MIDLTSLPCPVCGKTNSSVYHQTTYPEHGYPGEFTLNRCNGCGLLFNSPRLDGDELAGLYGKNYYFFLRDDRREFDRIVAMHQRTIGLANLEGLEKRCIDIGSGRGYFPVVLRRLGWDASGIEISSDAADYSRQRFGLDVFTGTVEQYAGSSGAKRYPLVTAIDVIEHVPDPQAFIAAAVRIVEPGGCLIIDTPNAGADNITRKGLAWKGFNPFHVYLFTIDNLTQMLARHGMSVQASLSYGNAIESSSVRDRLIGALRSVGLLRLAVKSYFAVRSLTRAAEGEIEPFIEAAASRIMREPAYNQTSDATAPLAVGKTGDNIVVIAIKS